jgi:hypothetical protein
MNTDVDLLLTSRGTNDADRFLWLPIAFQIPNSKAVSGNFLCSLGFIGR